MNSLNLIAFQNNPQVQELITKALQCPLFAELAHKACTIGDPLKGKKGPIIVGYDPVTCGRFGVLGFTDHTNRTIYLATLHKVKALDVLIFEVANASQTTEFRAIQAGIKDLTRDDYAKEMERMEYTSKQLHHKIAAYGNEQLQWPAEVDQFKESTALEFEQAWIKELRANPHADLMRKQHDSIRAKIGL